MSKQPTYEPIVSFCQDLLARHGDSAAGVGWTAADADARYRVMLDCIRPAAAPCSLLDFGCGAGHLLDFIRREGVAGIEYHGLDVSGDAVELCRTKFPGGSFVCHDVMEDGVETLGTYDYVVMNGIFTYRGEVGEDAMWDYLRRLLRLVFPVARRGIAFNVMSKQVDWEREDLFHLPLDPLLDFLSRELTRHVVVRHDYGLYEYTVYAYPEASDPSMAAARRTLRGTAAG